MLKDLDKEGFKITENKQTGYLEFKVKDKDKYNKNQVPISDIFYGEYNMLTLVYIDTMHVEYDKVCFKINYGKHKGRYLTTNMWAEAIELLRAYCDVTTQNLFNYLFRTKQKWIKDKYLAMYGYVRLSNNNGKTYGIVNIKDVKLKQCSFEMNDDDEEYLCTYTVLLSTDMYEHNITNDKGKILFKFTTNNANDLKVLNVYMHNDSKQTFTQTQKIFKTHQDVIVKQKFEMFLKSFIDCLNKAVNNYTHYFIKVNVKLKELENDTYAIDIKTSFTNESKIITVNDDYTQNLKNLIEAFKSFDANAHYDERTYEIYNHALNHLVPKCIAHKYFNKHLLKLNTDDLEEELDKMFSAISIYERIDKLLFNACLPLDD